jgi:hypothetical protein
VTVVVSVLTTPGVFVFFVLAAFASALGGVVSAIAETPSS